MKNFIYHDILKTLIEEEILLLKYNPDVNRDLKVKEILKEWDSTHDIKTFDAWLSKKILELNIETFVASNVFEDEETDEFLWEVLLLKQYTLTRVVLKFVKEFKSTKAISHLEQYDDAAFRLIKLTLLNQMQKAYKEFEQDLENAEIPQFINSGFYRIRKIINQALTAWEDFDKMIALSRDAFEYFSDFLESLENLEISLDDQELDSANVTINWMLYASGIIYNLLLLFETFSIHEDERLGVEPSAKSYEIVEERELRLEMLKMIADPPKN
ncbi:hypothetical protein [Williamsoniiplasma lucivorax]|uniref:Uncharacterized protein n=1 Tax=Williamsoniiplasma lucivorax TaxID=209274 RepID=A0A2S5R9T2_9MOLU|nr:hypothetical protein [Williamsoniiplasma lucivorax]PPE04084.1 hypothetical protein ELUCI_v1c08640 [Williamsoniiplasma lucivorax]